MAARCNIEEISEMIAEVGGEALDAPGVAGVAVYQDRSPVCPGPSARRLSGCPHR